MTERGMSLRATARAAGYSDHTLLSKALGGHKPVTPYLAAPVLALPAEMRLTTFDGKLARTAALATAPPYRGSQAARGLVDEVAGYLGADTGSVPYPLALGPAAS